MAGTPALSAVSAPSSLAVELAVASGLTLVGFSRGRSLNVYSRPDRVIVSEPGDESHRNITT
jgi:FdhD protein